MELTIILFVDLKYCEIYLLLNLIIEKSYLLLLIRIKFQEIF